MRLVVLISSCAMPVMAQDFLLDQPIDCALGDTCYIQNYVDVDPSDNARDFQCGSLTYDTHKGTDFGLPSLAAMEAGVNVLAAANGTVLGTRDNMRDVIYTEDLDGEINGRDCGNGMVISHGNGWETQYCHLKQGSIRVEKGQEIEAGTVIGQVGLSGRTQFPHVHLSVRKHRQVVDPFDPDGVHTCGVPSTETLWEEPIPYRPGGVLATGFSDAIPQFAEVKSGTAAKPTLSTDAPAIVIYGFVFGARAGDQLHMVLSGPKGVMLDDIVDIPKPKAQMFHARGKKRRSANWAKGTYAAEVSLLRDGQIINTERTRIQID